MAFEQFEVVVVKEEANLFEDPKTDNSDPDTGLLRNIKKEITVPKTFERTAHPSAEQQETLLDILEKKPNLAKGFAKTQYAKQAANKEWVRITAKLNSLGGALKTTKKWIKYWSDKKSAVKKKAAVRAAARAKSDGGMVDDYLELSDIEERIVTLMNGQSFTPRLQPPALYYEHESPSPLMQAGSTRSVMPVSVKEEEECVINSSKSAPMDQVITFGKIDNEPIHSGRSTPITQVIVLEEVDNNTSATVEPPAKTQQNIPEPVQPQSSAPTSPRRIRRRRTSINSSLPQRPSNLVTVTDKFLHLEEQRIDLEKRVIAVMERNSETNILMAEAMKSMGEGLKALAEAIKR